MPRIRQNADRYRQSDFIREIDTRCAWCGIKTNQALGKVLEVSGASIGNYREDPEKMQVRVLKRMVSVLKLDIPALLAFLGYTEKEIRKFVREYGQEGKA